MENMISVGFIQGSDVPCFVSQFPFPPFKYDDIMHDYLMHLLTF